jgi:uncharacterized membrane protein YoaK (UPF0700 family)
MYRLEKHEFVKSPYLLLWSLLGFQAGYINAFGFLACGRYVSHLTGGLVASILLLIGSAKLKTKIAFGPFLILGFFVVKYFGYDFLNFLK